MYVFPAAPIRSASATEGPPEARAVGSAPVTEEHAGRGPSVPCCVPPWPPWRPPPSSPPPTAANAGPDNRAVRLTAQLTELNGSGASGTATALVRGETVQRIEVHAKGLTPNVPHAQHIHYGEQALNECPTLALDDNADGRLNTLEGVPAYGPVVVSLNTTGDTSPASFLKVDRFPVATADGRIDYLRKRIPFTDVAGTGYAGGGTAEQIAAAVRGGEGIVVVHGLDYDGNDTYNVSDPDGLSELDPALPAEATDPAVCGVLR